MPESIRPNPKRRALVAISAGLALALAAVALLLIPAGTGRAAEPPLEAQAAIKRAYVVVGFGPNDVIVRPITFTGQISAFVALQKAGLDVVYAVHPTYGEAVCAISGVGTAVEPDGQNCTYSGYFFSTFYWEDDAWQYRTTGVGTSMISTDGHVEGFEWTNSTAWPPVSGMPAATPFLAANRALQYLMRQQSTSTGGYAGTVNDNVEVLFAASADRCDPTQWHNGDGNPDLIDYIETNGPLWLKSANAAVRLGKLNTGLASTAVDVESWQGMNLVLSTTNLLSATGPSAATYFHDQYDTFSPMYHAWAMLGLQTASQTVPVSATNWLLEQQLANGGWPAGDWDLGDASTDATALAMMALMANGVLTTDTSIVDGLAYLDDAQGSDGGFPYYWNGTDDDSVPESTALVVQALLAAGQDPSASRWTQSGNDPYDYLLSMQLADGSFEHVSGAGANLMATRQAILGLLGRPFPLDSAAELSVCPQVDVHNFVHLPLVIKE